MHAIGKQKHGKEACVDKINGEILKAGGEKISKIAEHL
jgi:hypothetical protein